MDETSKQHRRRPHYSGKYPRRFEEKYKEQDPERYADEIEHVISKGNTPAGMHIPIMVDEILDFLQVQPGQIGLDCTLGYGGHSSKLLERLEGKGHLYSIDYDPIEIEKTTRRLREKGFGDEIWTPVSDNFRNIDRISEKYGPFDFVMADLGVSSMQIDDPSRGFTWKADGPLDLRFNPQKGESASRRLAGMSRDDIEDMLRENSDEPYAGEIADAIHKVYWRRQSIETTGQLRAVVEEALEGTKSLAKLPKKDLDELKKKSLARVFQALRIDVNQELEVLEEFLDKLPSALKSGGRAAILTFHSGEDRLVKKSFKSLEKAGVYREAARDVIRPSREEYFRNPRAHSTKMRWAVKA